MSLSIEETVAKLPQGPLNESSLREHVWPLFSRVLGSGPKGIYLANHSLGRPLDQTAADVARALDLWYSRLDSAWDDDGWPSEMAHFRGRVAQLIGLSDPSLIIPKTSAGQGLRAVLNALPRDGKLRPLQIVATRGEFDSVDFILKTYIQKGRAEVTWIEPTGRLQGIEFYETSRIIGGVRPETDLVVVSQIVFSTGQVIEELDKIIGAAHEADALVLVDAYHAAGVIPLKMERLGADFMIGGSYKYTRGGPGACWLAIHPRHLNDLRTLDTGWFAKKDPFAYERPDFPETRPDGNAWLESTPPVLTFYQAAAGLQLTLAIGVERLRKYSLGQQQILRDAFQKHDVPCIHPTRPESFGAFSLVPSDSAAELSRALKSAGVVTDARSGAVRFGPDILSTESELDEAARITSRVLQ